MVIQPVHHPGEGGEGRTNRKGEQHYTSKGNPRGSSRFLVLSHRSDRQAQAAAGNEQVQSTDQQPARGEQQQVAHPQGETAEPNRAGASKWGKTSRLQPRAKEKPYPPSPTQPP